MRLLQEVEKLKKQMSANSTRLPLNVECFMEERDVSGDLQRSQMEQICSDTFNRVERTLKGILHNASKCIFLVFILKNIHHRAYHCINTNFFCRIET